MKNLRLIRSNRLLGIVQLSLAIVLALIFLLVSLWGLPGVSPAHANPGTLYVDSATGSDTSNNCQNPLAPCETINHADSQATAGDTILIAVGTYTENLFMMGGPISLTLRGGYTVSGTQWLPDTGETIIKAANENAEVVFISADISRVLENLTITGGRANDGSGISISRGNVTLRSLIVTGNGQSSAIEVNNDDGVAHLNLENSLLINNSEGALNVNGVTATLTNVLVISNTSTGNGALRAVLGGRLTIQNSTIADNSDLAILGNSLGGISPTIIIRNTIVWSNTGGSLDCSTAICDGVTYSDIEGGWPGTNNINTNPLFVGGGDYHLQSDSPCIDTGTNVGAPDNDLDQRQRPQDGDGDGIATTDMGAYEFMYQLYLPLILKSFGA